jgi:hypothetical protein
MQRLLLRLPVRIGPFRPATALAVAVALLVLVVLLIARACSDGTQAAHDGRPPVTASSSAGASGSASIATDGDDGEGLDQPGDASPSVAPGQPAPTTVADAVATAWVQRTLPADRWLAGLRPWMTPAALDSLAEADPNSVPAERVTGTAQVILSDVSFAQCRVPLDFGSLRLRLLSQTDGRWLVDGIAWDRS